MPGVESSARESRVRGMLKNEMLLLLRPGVLAACTVRGRSPTPRRTPETEWAKAAFKADYFSDTNILILTDVRAC